jgi:hypothetical protein
MGRALRWTAALAVAFIAFLVLHPPVATTLGLPACAVACHARQPTLRFPPAERDYRVEQLRSVPR